MTARLSDLDFDTLDTIKSMDGRECTLADLAERLGSSVDALDKRMRRMESRGIVTRELVSAHFDGRPLRYIVIGVSELGARMFGRRMDEMAVAS